MSSADRLRQLRDLAGRLELLPASEERDSMLRKVRARTVDVDTGVPTTPLVATHAARKRAVITNARAADPACVESTTGWRSRASRPSSARVDGPIPTLSSSDVLAAGELLCLEDLPTSATPPHRPRTRGAWERGLRG